MRALALGVGWLGGYYLLVQYGALALPKSIARQMTLPQYLATVQLVSVVLGLTAVFLTTKNSATLRATIFPETARARRTVPLWALALWAALLGPLTYLLASKLAISLALDTLLAEIANRGAQAVQQQTGELGQRAQADTLSTILPFTVVIAPLGEELLFRGGVYGAVQSFFKKKARSEIQSPSDDAPPSSIAIAGLPKKKGLGLGPRLALWATSGGIAMLVSSAVFGAMHADVPGGMGMVRLVSASVLGCACGLVRHASGSLVAPIALHVVFNFLALATMRRWLVFEGWPTELTVPTILTPLSLVCTSLALAHAIWWTRLRRVPAAG